MKKIIFFSLPGHGHINPTLSVASELVKRGNQVIYYSTDEFKEKVEKAGVRYKSYHIKESIDGRISKNISIFAAKLMDVSVTGVPFLLEEMNAEKPDYIAHDTLALWGKFVGYATKIPTISLITTFAFNNTVARHYAPMYLKMAGKALTKPNYAYSTYTKYRKLCKTYSMKKDSLNNILMTRENLNIVFTSSYMQPCSNSFDNTFKFVGPSLFPRNENDDFTTLLDTNKKIIYISMGTIFNDNLDFYKTCIETFADTKYQIIISLGHRFAINELQPIPANIIVRNYIPQLQVLERANAFITHGGLNSISESLFYNVPMVIIPQLHEQQLNAIRIKELGAGIYLKKRRLSKKRLLKSVEKILSSTSFYENASKIQKTLIDAGGYKKAADLILSYEG